MQWPVLVLAWVCGPLWSAPAWLAELQLWDVVALSLQTWGKWQLRGKLSAGFSRLPLVTRQLPRPCRYPFLPSEVLHGQDIKVLACRRGCCVLTDSHSTLHKAKKTLITHFKDERRRKSRGIVKPPLARHAACCSSSEKEYYCIAGKAETQSSDGSKWCPGCTAFQLHDLEMHVYPLEGRGRCDTSSGSLTWLLDRIASAS